MSEALGAIVTSFFFVAYAKSQFLKTRVRDRYSAENMAPLWLDRLFGETAN